MVPGLKKLAEKLGILDRTHWLEMLKGDLKWGTMRAADALIHPSHHENFGIVIAEAITPVLISDKVNTSREVVASHGGRTDTVEGTRKLILPVPGSLRGGSRQNEECGASRLSAVFQRGTISPQLARSNRCDDP